VTETEVKQLTNQELADLDQLVRAERERRSRLSTASAGVADLLKSVRADGGDPNQVISEALAVVGATGGVAPEVNPSDKDPSSKAFGQSR
jgi:hypothetical protein